MVCSCVYICRIFHDHLNLSPKILGLIQECKIQTDTGIYRYTLVLVYVFHSTNKKVSLYVCVGIASSNQRVDQVCSQIEKTDLCTATCFEGLSFSRPKTIMSEL